MSFSTSPWIWNYHATYYWYCDSVGIFIVEEAVLTTSWALFKRLWFLKIPTPLKYRPSRHKLRAVHILLSAIDFTNTRIFRWQNCTTAHWHRLEASVVRTMPFHVLPRYHTSIWQAMMVSHTFPAFCALYTSMRSRFSLQMAGLLYQCHFHLHNTYKIIHN